MQLKPDRTTFFGRLRIDPERGKAGQLRDGSSTEAAWLGLDCAYGMPVGLGWVRVHPVQLSPRLGEEDARFAASAHHPLGCFRDRFGNAPLKVGNSHGEEPATRSLPG